jgi:hypothetical protein
MGENPVRPSAGEGGKQMTISLKTYSTGLKTADPFFEDLSLSAKHEIRSLRGLVDLVDTLKDELKRIDPTKKFWTEEHNLVYGIYLRGQNKIRHGLVPSIGKREELYTGPGEEFSSSVPSPLLRSLRTDTDRLGVSLPGAPPFSTVPFTGLVREPTRRALLGLRRKRAI